MKVFSQHHSCHAGNDEFLPVQLFYLLTTYNPPYILFIGPDMLLIENTGFFNRLQGDFDKIVGIVKTELCFLSV